MDVRTGSLDLQLTAFDVFTILLVLFFGLRAGVIRRVAPPTEEKPAEYQDWSATRKWRWVILAAIPVGGVYLGAASVVWSWWEIVFLQKFDLILLGTILSGILLYVFVLHKLGM